MASVLLTTAASADAARVEAVRNLCLTAAGVATAVVYTQRSRRRIIAALRAEVREERKYNHLDLIRAGMVLENQGRDPNVVPLRAAR